MKVVIPEPLDILTSNLDSQNEEYLTDNKVTTQAQNLNFIELTLALTAQEWLGIFNIEGIKVELEYKDKEDRIIKAFTYDLDDSGISNFWQYLYFPNSLIQYRNKLIIPLIVGIDLKVTLRIWHTSQNIAKVGYIVLGRGIDIGMASYEAGVGIHDYSSIELVDGELIPSEVKMSNYYEVDLYLSPERLPYIRRLFERIKGINCLWLGSERDEGKQIMGFYKSFDPVYVTNGKAKYKLEIEGVL